MGIRSHAAHADTHTHSRTMAHIEPEHHISASVEYERELFNPPSNKVANECSMGIEMRRSVSARRTIQCVHPHRHSSRTAAHVAERRAKENSSFFYFRASTLLCLLRACVLACRFLGKEGDASDNRVDFSQVME